MASRTTTTSDLLFIPEVAKASLNGQIGKKIQFINFMKIDNTLQGRAGDTVTVPKYGFIGGAKDVAEGAPVPFEALKQTTDKYTVKQAGKGVELTRHALMAGGREQVSNQTIKQLAKAMDLKIEEDYIEALSQAVITHTDADIISYAGVVNALDVFAEEDIAEKIIIIAPQQVTQLRLDPLFIDKSKYGNDVMATGEIGTIASARVIVSRHIKEDGSGNFENYIVLLDEKDENGEEVAPAVTAFIASDLDWNENIDEAFTHKIATMKDFLVAITNDAKVMKATFKAKK